MRKGKFFTLSQLNYMLIMLFLSSREALKESQKSLEEMGSKELNLIWVAPDRSSGSWVLAVLFGGAPDLFDVLSDCPPTALFDRHQRAND